MGGSHHSEDGDHDYEELTGNPSIYMHLAAGAAAGIMEHAVMYPFDSIKTRMQVVESNKQLLYSGLVQSFKHVTTSEGARALWRGISSMIAGAGPAHAVYFAAYEQAKHYLSGGDDKKINPLAAGLAGGIGTIVSDMLMNPFDVIKQRMQVEGAKYKTIINCTRSILKTEGFTALYVSYPTTLLMNLPLQSIQFGLYDVFKKTLNPDHSYSPLTHVTSGALSGAIAAAVTTPIDCAKTLLQTRGLSSDIKIRTVSGVIEPFKIIIKLYGFKGLFRGILPRVISFMPGTAISWTTYEYFKYFISS
ncbi:hypothetical protein BB559_002605 [Furculomyces boomerangus]|uniref:Mitochondrial thiamine pyrophosphate carrier 1 n=2 Tax=Harpellales TaxID=61421 RepID=A0A2T9YTY1_9FUNG|nr:hypothetical protein BB559_002605 [Furculomyces boomerangus]PVZ98326.1 hypothetical protein BB558_005665 [Smittium angustum]